MTGPGPGVWAGCHGVRLHATAGLELGRAAGDPLLEGSVTRGALGDPEGEELWRLAADVDTGAGTVHAEQALWRRVDGTVAVRNTEGDGLDVDPSAAAVVVDGRDDAVMAQLVVTYGLPLLLTAPDVVVVHAAACALDGRAVLVCGERGRGKSSILVGLTTAGWHPVSEDLCAIDLRGAAPLVWPGPPWVRRVHGEPGPVGAAARFETADKTGWDMAPWQALTPVPLGAIVFLDAPGGQAPVCSAVARPARLGRLAGDVVWLHEPEARGPGLFDKVARLTAAVPAWQVRLPRDPSWLAPVPELLGAVLARGRPLG